MPPQPLPAAQVCTAAFFFKKQQSCLMSAALCSVHQAASHQAQLKQPLTGSGCCFNSHWCRIWPTTRPFSRPFLRPFVRPFVRPSIHVVICILTPSLPCAFSFSFFLFLCLVFSSSVSSSSSSSSSSSLIGGLWS